MKNFVQKSTLALAIAAASSGVMAGDLDRTSGVAPGGTSAIVLANEVFGSGSEDTLVAIPDVTFAVDAADGVTAASNLITIKFTLDSGAVFGEDLSSLDKWEDAGVTLVFRSADGAADLVVGGVGAGNTTGLGAIGAASGYSAVAVTQGGAIGDNTVTFQLTVNDSVLFDEVDVEGFKVKNLTAALERGVANPAVKLGAEYRNLNTGLTDTDVALTILSSKDGVELEADTVSDYDDAVVGLRARIDVADTELSFTGDSAGVNVGSNAGQDFDETDNVSHAYLGEIAVVRTQYSDNTATAVNVKKEDANDFDFNGSDTILVTLTSTSPLSSYSSVYLRTDSGDGVDNCDGSPTGADFLGSISSDGLTATVNLTGESTTALGVGYDVCLVASGTAGVPESTFTAALNVEYFNPRYTNSDDTLSYGSLLRNGCQVTLFNMPNPTSGDKAFVRLTNVSELPGAVRGYIWTEDGQQIDLNSELTPSLAAHATAVYSTDSSHPGYIGTAMTDFAAVTSGRHRLVLQGAFPACEALGLIRTPAGVLTNMTSTTYAGDDSRLGSEQSNTSNTSN